MTTKEEYISIILLTVGDSANGTLAANIDLLWASHSAVANDALVALLTKRDAIDVMLAEVRYQVDFKALDGASVSASDMFDHLMQMRALTDAQIAAAQSGLDGSAAIGQLTTTAPIMRDTAGQPNPNDRVYKGDPLRRRGVRTP